MITPVTRVGNPSSVARRPRSVLCRPAPSMSTPMPRSNGPFAVIALNGTLRPTEDRTRTLPHASGGGAGGFSQSHEGIFELMHGFCLNSEEFVWRGRFGMFVPIAFG